MTATGSIRAETKKVAGEDEARCFVCYEGTVFLGRLAEVDGEEVEVIEAVKCRRCTGLS